MKKLLAIMLVLALCLPLAACAREQGLPQSTAPTQESQSTGPSQNGTENTGTKPIQPAPPQQEMCWHCGDVPVSGSDIYCVNCRCLKCDQRRKLGGDYLYCGRHNCNESLCEYPAFDDSRYCSEHKCRKPNCDNRRWSGSEYCATHK